MIQTADTGLQARSGVLVPAHVCRLTSTRDDEGKMNWRARFVELRQWKKAARDAYDNQAKAEECKHPQKEIRLYVIAGGGIQYVHQCLDCGEKVGGPVAHSKIQNPDALRPYDPEFRSQYRKAVRVMAPMEIDAEHERRWWELYEGYLASPEWAAKRAEVITLCGRVCQGCKAAIPTQVHHLSYANVGDELLFQVVALCGTCHEKCHDD